MNIFTGAISIDWMSALGWTLLHSLWQAAIVLLLTTIMLRLIPARQSSLRYTVASAGLLLLCVIGVATFIQQAATFASADRPATPIVYQAVNFSAAAVEEDDLGHSVMWLLEQNMAWIVLLWAIGFFVFALRWALGLYQTNRIRSNAQMLGGEWLDYVQHAAMALNIRRPVKIAESIAIGAPLVLGYIKPLILIPTGMVGGLSTQQLETIFLHELAHIRRNDYLMNFFQTILECIFFFNPFVRMISNTMRREREYCCDDIVVAMHGNSSAYAHALVRLAEARLAAPAFALSLTGNENQLLGRIKRIMDRSSKNAAFKSRLMIPALLVAGALASISWISADSDEKNDVTVSKADTIPHKNKDGQRARFSKKRIITIDENGQPHEEVIQEFEGDEDLRALLENEMSIFNDSTFTNGFQGFNPGQFYGPGQFHGGMLPLWNDTMPPLDQEDWQAFADDFQAEFRKHFRELFQGDGDPSKFMEEFQRDFGWEQWSTPFETLPLDSLNRLHHDDIFRNFREEFEMLRDFAPEGLNDLKQNFRSLDNPIQHYERALQEQLREDGYLSPDETIQSLQWSDDSFKVNGKSLKPGDVKKYNDLRKGILEQDVPIE